MTIPFLLIPGAPLLVPELSGPVPTAAALRAAVLGAAGWLGTDRWDLAGWDLAGWDLAGWDLAHWGRADSGAGSVSGIGSFHGFGADVVVSAGPGQPGDGADQELDGLPDLEYPLPWLIAAWVRGQVAPSARLVVEPGQPRIIVADGPATIGPKAPGGERPAAAGVFARLVAALGAADGPGIGALADELAGVGADPRAWIDISQTLAGPVTIHYADAPHGVGYIVATGTLIDSPEPAVAR